MFGGLTCFWGPQVDGEWRTEIIRDAAVINAYVKKRQAIEEENTTADALAPTGDAEKDKRMKKRCVCSRRLLFFIPCWSRRF